MSASGSNSQARFTRASMLDGSAWLISSHRIALSAR
jgi:hypothetical protein